MNSASPSETFRDPAGSLSLQGDLAIRRISPSARGAVLDLLDSALCQTLQRRGDLIDATIADSGEELLLHHPRIPIPTYPWEWTPRQWLAAAELTLDLCQEAINSGWILKDATPLNILFTGARPVMVDILSFEPRDPGSSIWLAYGQYVRTFLLPLLMNRMLGWPLSLSLFKRDGYEPAECYEALSWVHRLSRDALWPVTLPTLLDKRNPGKPASQPTSRRQDAEVSAAVLERTLNDLRRRTRRALPRASSSDWSDYQGTLTHYTAEQSLRKVEWVRAVLQKTRPARVLDIGANTGEFSALAGETAAEVVALERDMAAADRLFAMSRERKLPIQTIHADLARPTPAAGWENSESLALLPRLEGHFDLVMMLAVIHHLVLMEQIPIARIVRLCHRLTTRHLVVEWVPVADPMYQSLMRGRDSLYGSLSQADLLASCQGLFRVVDAHTLENGRILFHFEKVTETVSQ
jgi:SAM-dependent methyltransferase